jgi:CheY-like chemotaxis protein/PAS domain-containing protein
MERTGFEQWKPREVARLLALVETERRYYQEMMATLPAALAVLANDRTILSANMAFRRLAGLSGEELRKRTIEQVLPSNELIERLRAVHVQGDTGAFFITVPASITAGERRFRMAAASIRGWEDDMELETLLLVQPMDESAAAIVTPAPAEPVPTLEPAALESEAAEPPAPEPLVVEPLVAEPPAAEPPSPEPPLPEPEASVVPETLSTPIAPPEPESHVEWLIDLGTLPAAVWQADPTTFAFAYVGGAAQEILGYSAAHWLAEPLFFFERIHPEDRDEVMALYRSVTTRGGEAGAEYRALKASGESVWCRETIRVPALGEGAWLISGVTSVIEERRQLELQSLTAARIDALRGLASRLAHDLNNPLMILAGYGEELLNALPEGDPLRGDLTEVLAASSRLTELASHLLSFARVQTKAASKIDLTKLVAELAQRDLAPRLGKEIELEIADPVLTFADPGQLEDAIIALAAFAIENTSGASRLSLMCHTGSIAERVGTATLKPGVYARLDIQAVGAGMSAPPAGVFESILPGRDPHRPAGPAVARAYLNVRQWGGDISFSSGVEQGSTFALYLPYVEPERQASPAGVPEESLAEIFVYEPALEPAPEPVPEPPRVEPSLGTVLVVEDEPGIRGLVRKILKRERYEVLEAGSGEEALVRASSHGAPIGLLLTDVMLPGIEGRELAEALTGAQPDLKVVYISGFTDDETVRAGQFPPGSLFLQKPFTLSALVDIVKQAFDKP